MNFLKVYEPDNSSHPVLAFGSLSYLEKTAEGEITGDENMSDEFFPCLSSGGRKMFLSEFQGKCMGLLAKDKLCAVVSVGEGESAASKMYYGSKETPLVLTSGEKELVSMGTKIVVFPDKLYYDTYSGEYGSLESFYKSGDGVKVEYLLTRADGSDYNAQYSATPPESPADGAFWCDTSVFPSVLKVYSAQTESWTAIETVYVKIVAPDIGKFFGEGDGVLISGCVEEGLNGSALIVAAEGDYVIVHGIVESCFSQTTPLSVSRRVPEMDFVTECDNRLWGCRFGLNNDGDFVNEIYASKLGDPFNWQCFEGIASDSYAASLGTPGAFTGAVTYLGNVHFFKENTLHKVFGTKPSNFQITSTAMRGVEKGSSRSLCIIDEILYYKGSVGIMAFDGAFPWCVSDKLGRLHMKKVVCGRGNYALFVSFENEKGERELYTYKPSRSIWHRLSPADVSSFVNFGGFPIYAEGNKLYAMEVADSDTDFLSDVFGCDKKLIEPERWMFETADLVPDNGRDCYVTRVHLKVLAHKGATVKIRMKCNGGDYVPVGYVSTVYGQNFCIPVATGRCSSLKLEVSGTGKVTVFGIGRTVSEAPVSFGGAF